MDSSRSNLYFQLASGAIREWPFYVRHISSDMRTALIIGAHPDDAILGVGGTATLLKRSGWRVVILTATRGGMGGNESAREREELDSTSLLSFLLHQGTLPDGAFGLDPGIRLIDPLVKKYRPDMVFTHAPDDTHHRGAHSPQGLWTPSGIPGLTTPV